MNQIDKWDWETSQKELIDLNQVKSDFVNTYEPLVSDDGEKVALPVQGDDDLWTLNVNGENWPESYDLLWYPKFGPDNRLTAIVQVGGLWTVAVDGVPWEEKAQYVWNTTFSPDGSIIAVQIKRGEVYYSMMVNGKPWKNDYFSSRELALDNGGSLISTVQVEKLMEADTEGFMKGTWSLACNDKVWDARFVNVYTPIISADGKHLAAQVRTGICEYTIAKDGKPWPNSFGCVWEPVFDPKNSVTAPVKADGGWGMAKDGTILWPNRYVQLWNPVVSPDGTRLAATASPSFGKWTIAVDDKIWPVQYSDAVLAPVFSADSQKVAAIVRDNGRWSISVDGTTWAADYDMVWDPVFSPDGSLVAAKVEEDGAYTVAINGKPWDKSFQWLWSPIFSPDGTKLLIKAVEEGKYIRQVVDVESLKG